MLIEGETQDSIFVLTGLTKAIETLSPQRLTRDKETKIARAKY